MTIWNEEEESATSMPAQCHVVLPGLPLGSNVALCVFGQAGVGMTEISVGDTDQARAVVRSFNASLGIDAATEFAMLAGCLMGWDHELANPRFVRSTDPRFWGSPPGVVLH